RPKAVRLERRGSAQPLERVLGDLDNHAGRGRTYDRTRINSAHGTTIVTAQRDETGIRHGNREAVQSRVVLAGRLISGARTITGDLIGDVLCRRADRRSIGSPLHLALHKIPMTDLHPNAGEAEQHRQHEGRYETNSTRT